MPETFIAFSFLMKVHIFYPFVDIFIIYIYVTCRNFMKEKLKTETNLKIKRGIFHSSTTIKFLIS